MTDEPRYRLISLSDDDSPAHVPVWRRAWCILTGGHRTSRIVGLRYGSLVTCGRCGWTEARW